MDKITFDNLPDAIALLLKKVEGLEFSLAQLSPKPTEEEKLLTPSEACEFLGGISKPTLWAWEKAGKIQKHSIGGKVFYKRTELLAGMDSLKRYGGPVS